MKNSIVVLFLFFAFAASAMAVKFDMKQYFGFEIGMSKSKVEKILKEKGYTYKIINNNAGGKILVIDSSFVVEGEKSFEVRLLWNKKNNIESIIIDFDIFEWGRLYSWLEKLKYEIANSKHGFDGDELGWIVRLEFDNCRIYIVEDNYSITITMKK